MLDTEVYEVDRYFWFADAAPIGPNMVEAMLPTSFYKLILLSKPANPISMSGM